jgi:hypothetical protein
MDPNHISTQEVQQILKCSQPWVNQLRVTGKLHPVGKFAGRWIFDKREVECLARQRERERNRA